MELPEHFELGLDLLPEVPPLHEFVFFIVDVIVYELDKGIPSFFGKNGLNVLLVVVGPPGTVFFTERAAEDHVEVVALLERLAEHAVLGVEHYVLEGYAFKSRIFF